MLDASRRARSRSPAGDVLDTMELRHDWSKMVFTLELFKYVLFTLIPEVIKHTESQDEEQVRDHYDRALRVFSCLLVSLIFLPTFSWCTWR